MKGSLGGRRTDGRTEEHPPEALLDGGVDEWKDNSPSPLVALRDRGDRWVDHPSPSPLHDVTGGKMDGLVDTTLTRMGLHKSVSCPRSHAHFLFVPFPSVPEERKGMAAERRRESAG